MNREVFELVSRHITFSKRPLDASFDLKVCYLSYGTPVSYTHLTLPTIYSV